MGSVLYTTISTARPDEFLEQNFETAGGSRAIAQRLADYVTRILSGNELAYSSSVPPSIAFSVQGNMVQATGTFIFDAVIATDVFVINGVSFTCVASGATGNQFNVGASDTLTAASAAAVVNASVTALVAGYVTATSAAGATTTGVLTVTAVQYGLPGNVYTISTPDTTITPSGARLTGGAADATAQTITF